MKTILCGLIACLLATGCQQPQPTGSVHAGIMHKDGRSDIQLLVGTVVVRHAGEGTIEIVLEARNTTSQMLWVPSTDGSRGMIGCEAVNIAELSDSLQSIHCDHAICHFPDGYMQLKPGDRCRYVYQMPDGLADQVSISVWAPWRDSVGNLVSPGVKRKAVPENSILIEEVRGRTGKQ